MEAPEATGAPLPQPSGPNQPQAFFDDVFNMVNDYVADGFDAFEEFAKANLPQDANTDTVMTVIQDLYLHLKAKVEPRLAAFEQEAKAKCFEPPPQLDRSKDTPGTTEDYSPEAEEALDRQLAELRQGIALGRAAARQMRKDIMDLDKQIQLHGDTAPLQSVAAQAVQHGVAEEARALAEGAAQLQPLLSRAEQLRAKQIARTDRNPQTASVTAAKAINRHKLAVSGATAEDLRKLREKLMQGAGASVGGQ